MTTLVSWAGVDPHGPTSIYIASDSRISWGLGKYWNVGRKIFASKTGPEIFGYCGSVTFPVQVLGQLVEIIDSGLLFIGNESFAVKLEKLRVMIVDSYRSQPVSQHDECEIIYASRVGSNMSCTFHAAIIKVSVKGVVVENCALPEASGIIASTGTGKPSLLNSYEEWTGPKAKDPQGRGRTSRGVFGAFCDALASGKDPYSGGPPQLVGLYKVGPAISFGVIHNGSRFINGLEINENPYLNNVEWRNDLFERCCGNTMKILGKAQRQPRPNNA